MPLAPTTYMLLVRPTPGADDDVWDDELNTGLGLVDGHRHIVGEGRQIPSAGILIDADLSFTNHRITSVAGVAMQNLGAALTAGANEFFVTGGNAYFRNNAGTNVQLTSGATLTMTTAGGIAGDYTAVGAEVAFTDGTDTYTFKQQLGAGVRQFAKMQCGDLALTEYKAAPAGGVPANAVTLKSPAVLAGPYTLTMLAALPASTQPLLVSAVGVLTAPNTVRTISIQAASGILTAGTVTYTGAKHDVGTSGGVASLLYRIDLPAGARITQIVYTYNRGGAGTIQWDLDRRTGDGVGANFVNVATTSVAAGAGWTTVTQAAINHTMLAGWTYYLVVGLGNVANFISQIDLSYDTFPM